MNVLSLFDYSGKIKHAFIKKGHKCISLDHIQNPENNSVDLVTDFLDWNYKSYYPGYFNFIFIAFPCQTFSKASGGFHFKNNKPITSTAINSINMLLKLRLILDHFNCKWILENPTSAIGNNSFFKNLFKYEYSRLTQSNFGFPTRKQTDFYHNFNMLLMSPVTYRVNGKYQAYSIDSMHYRSIVTYPDYLVDYLVLNIINNVD